MVPTVPLAVEALLITGAEEVVVTVSVRVALPVPAAFVAPMLTLEVPAALGVPEIKPVV